MFNTNRKFSTSNIRKCSSFGYSLLRNYKFIWSNPLYGSKNKMNWNAFSANASIRIEEPAVWELIQIAKEHVREHYRVENTINKWFFFLLNKNAFLPRKTCSCGTFCDNAFSALLKRDFPLENCSSNITLLTYQNAFFLFKRTRFSLQKRVSKGRKKRLHNAVFYLDNAFSSVLFLNFFFMGSGLHQIS